MKFDLISIGCLSLDTVFEVPFLPNANSECFAKRAYSTHGGAAANVAAYSAFYGGLKVGLVSKVGADAEGQQLLARMIEYDVCVRGVDKVEDSDSTRIAVIYNYEQESHIYLVHLGAVEKLSVKDLPAEYISDSTLLYIAPCTPRVHQEFVEAGVRYRKLIGFNPGTVYFCEGRKSDLRQLLRFVDFLFLNEEEALEYSGEGAVEAAGLALQKLGTKYVVLTGGARGCMVFFEGGTESYPSHKVERQSLLGAGDAFAAGFLSEFIRTRNLESALKFGNALGAFAVTMPSSREPRPSRERFRDFLKRLA
jgi:sugar/nucleoside kinase (ribokinase family)